MHRAGGYLLSFSGPRSICATAWAIRPSACNRLPGPPGHRGKLIAAGAHVNTPTGRPSSIRLQRPRRRRPGAAKAGAEIDAASDNGTTALMVAVRGVPGDGQPVAQGQGRRPTRPTKTAIPPSISRCAPRIPTSRQCCARRAGAPAAPSPSKSSKGFARGAAAFTPEGVSTGPAPIRWWRTGRSARR